MASCFLIAACTHYLEGRTDYVYWVALVFTSTHFSPATVKHRGRTVVGPWRAQASLGTCCICSGFSVQAIAEGGSFGLVSCRCCRGALPSGSTALAQCHAPGGRGAARARPPLASKARRRAGGGRGGWRSPCAAERRTRRLRAAAATAGGSAPPDVRVPERGPAPPAIYRRGDPAAAQAPRDSLL